MKKNLLIILLLTISLQTYAQKKEKPFTEWSKDYANKVLKDSPWAISYQSPQGLVEAERVQIAREQSEQIVSRNRPTSAASRYVPVPVVIRLNSALPIRQAMVRLQQIASNYDKMNDKDRTSFDASTKDFLDCVPCEKFYVVTITKFKNSGEGIEEGIFQSMTLKDLKGKVFLTNDKGEQRELIQFIPPKKDGESAVFFFQRNDSNGKPLLSTENKELTFLFASEFLNVTNQYSRYLPRKFEFDVSKLISNENVIF